MIENSQTQGHAQDLVKENFFDKIAGMLHEQSNMCLNTRVTRFISDHCGDKRDGQGGSMSYTVMGSWTFSDNKTNVCAAQTQDGVVVIDPREKRIIQIYETYVPEGSRYAGRLLQYADPSAAGYIDPAKTWDGKIKRMLSSFNQPVV